MWQFSSFLLYIKVRQKKPQLKYTILGSIVMDLLLMFAFYE